MKVKAYLCIGYANADRDETVEIDDEELEDMTEDEKNAFISECVQDWADEYIEVGWNEVK